MTGKLEKTLTISQLKVLANEQPISKFLGINVLELAAGYAKVSVKMRPEFLNFNGNIFGGIITAVADEAFALCVSGVAHPSVATHLSVYFLSRVGPDDELTAEGRVVKKGRRVGFAEMIVTNQNGIITAKVTGTYVLVDNKD
jgi:acyl-CoA thioesterase